MIERKMRKIKTIKIDSDKCTGCRLCESICSAYHSQPPFGSTNPERSRIRVFRDEENDLYVPIIAGMFAEVECNARHIIIIRGKEYSECSFCRASCLSRDIFREPDSKVPLKCDVCGEPMPEDGPLCVRWCLNDALIYSEREEEIILKNNEDEEEVEFL